MGPIPRTNAIVFSNAPELAPGIFTSSGAAESGGRRNGSAGVGTGCAKAEALVVATGDLTTQTAHNLTLSL
jgi:hypothetical protein